MDQQEDDGLKWFGEGFDGFPKRLPDDCVEYQIYLVETESKSFSTVQSRFNEILKFVNALKKKYLIDYIWQRDGFNLTLKSGSDGHHTPTTDGEKPRSHVPPHLHGRTNFGDSIADEWLIVFLLLETSKRFEDTWIRVYDTDGEFLLIEAAAALPKWLNPEIAENRVWINKGNLKLIKIISSDVTNNITLSDALNTLQESPGNLLVDGTIQSAAFDRLEDYPAAITKSFHTSRTVLPRRVAWLLHRNTSFISSAVEAFYLRDPISLKPLSSKDLSTLSFPPEDFVTVSVKYTKVGFAQLRGQIFAPPPSWVGLAPRVQRDEKAAMGMKVACGMEMLVSDPQRQDDKAVREIRILMEDLESGEEKLPADDEIRTWQDVEDDESWLDVDYAEFAKELDGKNASGSAGEPKGFGDESAQSNLRKMVSRFEEFLDDDGAGAEGVDEMDNDDDSSASDSNDTTQKASSERAEKQPHWDSHLASVEFEKAISDIRGMTEDEIKTSGLLDEARKLALEDREYEKQHDDTESLNEEDGLQEIMALMEKEIQARKARATQEHGKSKATQKPFFGPEQDDSEEDIDLPPLSSDEEDYNDLDAPGQEDYNHVNLNLAKNLLESFKGQAGLPGPAGNLMRAMGMNGMMPRDADDAIDAER
ncbi:SGT1-domain-containing protein [Dissoconium aciculare CBS 342.82]|uniref:SGT1-domain-containing protein n=1 Tax=Dissoconium aciculare CBS 342.82 TaxID=1314786 RepID=A0A6J3MAJ2_9PEZI|nr:SGT1-domain-containing protein [Dissoconium aciculare CBS 342.82]KAF1825041.1 SGT1-domain-containing protein [Dissoconium aciculare CBS 342.82]